MNTPDIEKCELGIEHSTGANSTHLLKDTPDTEWEKSFGAQLEMRGIYGYPKDSIIEDVRIQLTSRDTYWKERVRKEVEKLRKPETTFLKEGDETWDYSHIIAHNQALDTLLDNLK